MLNELNEVIPDGVTPWEPMYRNSARIFFFYFLLFFIFFFLGGGGLRIRSALD